MAYTPKTWVNRQVERPRTYNLENNSDGSVTLLPAEGVVIEEGTPLEAVSMNVIENGLAEVSETVGNGIRDYIRQPAFAVTEGTSTTYTVTLNPAPSAILDGFGITIVPHVTNGANATLNVNGLGAFPLKKQNGIIYQAGKLVSGKPHTFRKVGTDFLADSTGGNGDALVSDVRAGKMFTNDESDDLTGTLTVRATGATTITPSSSAQVLQPGIYDSTITVSGVSVPAGNVLSGTTIAGTAGTMPNRGSVVITPTTYDQAITNGYHTGAGYVRGDANLTPNKILNGTKIFNVDGNVIPYFGGAFPLNWYSPGAGSSVGGYYEIFRIPGGFTNISFAGKIDMSISSFNTYQKMSFVIRDIYGNELDILKYELTGGSDYANQYGMFIDRVNRQITTVFAGSGYPDYHGGWSGGTDIGMNGTFAKPLDMNNQIIAYFKVDASLGGGYTYMNMVGKMAYN